MPGNDRLCHPGHGVSPGLVPSAPAAGPLPGLADFLTRALLRGPLAAPCHRLCTAVSSVVVCLPAAWLSSGSELCSPRVAPPSGPPPGVSSLCVCKLLLPAFPLIFLVVLARRRVNAWYSSLARNGHSLRIGASARLGPRRLGCVSEQIKALSSPRMQCSWRK